ncbi:serine hydroxymethyltransferase [Caldivirga sp.]|uniref:serine hydroxymethyltransferase n=1 Tax=Caldivirga sp. TaxID=2080243 RepID=UPI0025BF1084|nr:serine hydroxymethyltransferase [Caldivirga sp.]
MNLSDAINAVNRVRDIINSHNTWRRRETINLIPSENVMSPLAEYFYINDMMGRYAEGTIGNRYYQGVKYVDDMEAYLVDLMSKLFHASYVDVRPISGTVANMAVYLTLAKGGKIAAVPRQCGGHISHDEVGAPGALGLKVIHLPCDEENFSINVDSAAKVIREEKPQLVILGASLYLFPHPVKELAQVAHENGAYLMHDSAHVLGLIAGGQFPNSLNEGADLMTSSTHKTFPGPQGGVIFTNNESIFKNIQRAVFPQLTSNYHLHRYASTAITAIEMMTFGESYAYQVRLNAKRLAEELSKYGIPVVAEARGFTETHQVVFDASKFGGGAKVAQLLEDGGIIVNKNMLPWDRSAVKPSGIRMGVQEMTRVGMGTQEMAEIAAFMKAMLIDGKEPSAVRSEVKEFKAHYTEVKYGFKLSDVGIKCDCLPLNY